MAKKNYYNLYMEKSRGIRMDYITFIRNRITDLRMKKGISEYQMSYDLGHNRTYMHGISSGKALPSLKEFLAICDYFRITPSQFFDCDDDNPSLTEEILVELKSLNDSDRTLLLDVIKRFRKVSEEN